MSEAFEAEKVENFNFISVTIQCTDEFFHRINLNLRLALTLVVIMQFVSRDRLRPDTINFKKFYFCLEFSK